MAPHRMLLSLVAFAASVDPAEGAVVSPVQKVITLIDDFAGKVQKDKNAAMKEFENAAQFCDDESVAKDHAIKGTQEEIDSLLATIENQQAKLVEFGTGIQDTSARISSAEGELHAAVKQRESEHKDFLTSEKELMGTIGELDRAAKTLKQSVALMQGAPASKGLRGVLAGLAHIVEASFVTLAQKQKVQTFLQARENADDELNLNAEGQGGTETIIETVEDMTEKAESTLSDVRTSEMQENHEYMLLKQGIENGIKSTQEELSENTHGKSMAVQALAHAQKQLAVAKNSLADDTAYVADLRRDCQEKARTWEAETRDANAELKALTAAKTILTKKFDQAAFLQSSKLFLSNAKRVSVSAPREKGDAKARALRKLEKLGHKLHSTALVALAYRAASDPFGKIRGLVEEMIAKLQQKAADEATQQAFCDEETRKSTKSKDSKEEKLETLTARIEKAESTIATLTEQISTLATEIADIDSAVTIATGQRTTEKASFVVAEKDFSESQEACGQAIEVLREYYDGAGALLAQTGAQGGARAARDASGGGASGIIGLLEVAESDFAKLVADARSTEMAAEHDYQKLLQDSKLAKATKSAEQKGKESEVKSLKSALTTSKEDKDGITTELNAVVAYLAELRPQCDTKVPTYTERKAKREQEIDGLREALEILEADV